MIFNLHEEIDRGEMETSTGIFLINKFLLCIVLLFNKQHELFNIEFNWC